jgi:filamentous hemagglutinin family protein
MALIQCDYRVLSQRIAPLLISAFLLHAVMLGVGQAAVTSAITGDGTMGTTVTQISNAYTIGGGTITGSNLFHSFDRFSVGTGDSATFTGPPAIVNIVSRVTGGEQSVIDGLLRSGIDGANCYLLNPSGVLFGSNASLDVSGSFHVSTADFLRFADGATFSAHLGQESVLTVASPTAFGFLGNNPAAITIQGSTLRVREGQALSVVGGDVQLVEGTLRAPRGRIQLASVASPGGVMFSPLELAPDLQADSFTRLGRLTLSQGALVDASGNGGGSVLIRGGRLLVDGSNILANNTGTLDGSGLGVDLRITADAVLANGAAITTDSLGAGRARDVRLTAGSVHMNNALIRSVALGRGDGGHVAISTPTLTMDDGLIVTATAGPDRAGDIVVGVERLALTGGAVIGSGSFGAGPAGTVAVTATDAILISSRASDDPASGFQSIARGRGDAGRITISTPTLTMDGGQITASTSGTGRGGDVIVEVGRLTIKNGAIIDSTGLRAGPAGTVTVTATDAIVISGRASDGTPSAIASGTRGLSDGGRIVISTPTLTLDDGAIVTGTDGLGRGGDIVLDVGRLTLAGGGLISATTGPAGGPAGTVTVTATDAIVISGHTSNGIPSRISSVTLGRGDAGDITIFAPTVVLDGGVITATAETSGRGRAGDIVVEAGRLVLTGGGQISSSTFGRGQGGAVTVTAAESISISGRDNKGVESGILSQTFAVDTALGEAGNAGRIEISAPQLIISSGGRIGTDTAGDGRGGDIIVNVGSLSLVGDAQISSASGIQVGDQLFVGTGPGGNIEIRAQHIELSNGGTISARSLGEGEAGNIRIQASDTFLSRNGAVTTEAERAGGARIELSAGSMVRLIDSAITTTVRGEAGDAGDITIGSRFIILDNSRVIANAFQGTGGNIRIEAEAFLADPTSLVSASSALGIQGTVDIRAPVTSLSGTLAPLPQAFVSAAALLPARCAARAPGGAYSSLVLGGREGLPPAPGGLLPSPLALDARLLTDLPGTGDHSRQTPAARFALLHVADKVFPRLQGGMPPGGSPGLWPGAAPGNSWHTDRSTCM